MKGDFKIMKCVSYMRVGTKMQLGENMQKKDCCVKVKEKSAVINSRFNKFRGFCRNNKDRILCVVKSLGIKKLEEQSDIKFTKEERERIQRYIEYWM